MGLWIITRLKLRTDQMTTHRPFSRDQFILVRLDKREKYTIQAKKALLLMCSSCIAYLCYPVSLGKGACSSPIIFGCCRFGIVTGLDYDFQMKPEHTLLRAWTKRRQLAHPGTLIISHMANLLLDYVCQSQAREQNSKNIT